LKIDSVNSTVDIIILENMKYHQNNEQSIIFEVSKRSRTEAISVQEERKKDQEQKILSWFTLS